MKLIEKICPNCGASLSFGENDKHIECEYCKASYDIQRDTTKQEISIEDEYNLVNVQKFVSSFFTYMKISSIISFIVFIFVFIMILFVMFKIMSNM